MFGGLCFLHNGNMLCGVAKGKMVARVGPDAYESALKQKNVTEMDFTGKPLKGMVYILESGTKRKDSVKKWVENSLEFTKTLPKK
ncbi:MAG: TfoX/Sxy family protein [Deltaproteobacteria bacterium]|nr:TfoX/Sxy family protein [Deltaproteobacteria bacterium]